MRRALLAASMWAGAACGQTDALVDAATALDARSPFSFSIVGSATSETDRATSTMLRAITAGPSRFIVHFDLSSPSDQSCSDAALARRRAALDDSVKPVVPIVAAAEWADCGRSTGDPFDRLDRVGDVLFGGDESLGQSRLAWVRQSSIPRFKRYRENLRWQVGNVLFATVNLPDNNNNFRIAAGRNGEFEERLVANRAWLDRTFRLAGERRLSGIVLFVDAAPHFGAPLKAPDTRSRERDGFYEWKLAFRDFVPAFKGQVLLVQARYATGTPRVLELDRPLQDAGGRTIANFARIGLAESMDLRWLRVDVDPRDGSLFRVVNERAFDDPSGELYGPGRRP